MSKYPHRFLILFEYTEAKIVVHPECSQEVVDISDASGSTGFIVKYVKDAPKGSTIVIGTEINLIDRLSNENIDEYNVVKISENVKADAKKALNNMLELEI